MHALIAMQLCGEAGEMQVPALVEFSIWEVLGSRTTAVCWRLITDTRWATWCLVTASGVISQGECDGIDLTPGHHGPDFLTGAIVGGEIAKVNVARGFETPLK